MKPSLAAAIATCAAACTMLAPTGSAFAENGYWEPPNIRPAAVPLAAVLAMARARSGLGEATSERSERWTVRAAGLTFPASVTLRGDDFVVRSVLDGETYSSGRSDGFHWRSTPRGLVRLVQSDVQGDDLDRWPTALLPLTAQYVLAGETGPAAGAEWVLVDRREHDIPHWFFIDEATGFIVREVSREGQRIETTTFDDFRTTDGTTRPFHWHTYGPGGELDVQVAAVEAHAIDKKLVEIPTSTSDSSSASNEPQTLQATFSSRNRITVAVRTGGKTKMFLLDTGTPQIVLSEALARELHLHVALGHAILPELSLGRTTAHAVPVGVIGSSWFDGVLGYDFFAGHVVHIDYGHRRLETAPRANFAPPSDAQEIAAPFVEGMPTVAARVGRITGERFVLDTGSRGVVVLAYLLRTGSHPIEDLDVQVTRAARQQAYLEGRIETEEAVLRKFVLPFGTFKVMDGQVQAFTRNEDAEFPIDGIVGTDVLGRFEWWFDADAGRAWVRPAT